ncbi:MAG: hypothetical protein EPN94_05440 [Nitrospirae bacterium]|nr:MAG: hypothetical protein EPN94_05440 [Nitrospirota bacterium]
MARQVAVSFENETVKVVYALSNRGDLLIEKTLTLRDKEFDEFLEREKTRQFTVVCDFKSFYEDILLIPSTGEKYVKNIIASEIRKRFPELKDPSFFYTALGEKLHEGRMMKEIFIFAVSNEDLFGLINRFGKYNKKIKRLYPSAFALAHLLNLSGANEGKFALCIAEVGGNAALFLAGDKKLLPFRATRFSQKGIHNPDIQNINMTINYCRQSLKLNPSLIILIGEACYKYDSDMDLTLPVSCIMHPASILASKETLIEFITPVSALFPAKDMEEGNILPWDYRNFYARKAIIGYCIALFLILSLIGSGYTWMRMQGILSLKEKTESLRAEIKSMEPAFDNYRIKHKELQGSLPLINIINSSGSAPDFQKALLAIGQLYTKDINIQSVQINNEGASLRLYIRGVIASKGLIDMQNNYQALLNALKKNKELELLSEKIELTDKSFQIEAGYKGNRIL